LKKYRDREVPAGFYDQSVADNAARLVLKTCELDNTTDASAIKVLDFGCGAGRYMEVFAACVPKNNIVGVEVDGQRLSRARAAQFNCVMISPAKSVLPFDAEAFDVVFSSNVIEHIPRDLCWGYLKEIHRVLKRGGRLAIGAPNYPVKRIFDLMTAARTSQYRWYYFFDDPTHCNKRSIFAIEQDLKSLFAVVHLESAPILFESILPVLRRRKVRYLLRGLGNKFFGYCVKA
jgi:SAM-dependent methyltransferase